jgi:hypothetical protein
MGKVDWGVAGASELAAAFEAWPGSPYEKGLLLAFILRVRIETVVASMPRTVILNGRQADRVGRKLLLSIGEPGLSEESQRRRFRIVRTAIAAHEQICDLLHGRDPHPYPSFADLVEWSHAVEALEAELAAPSQSATESDVAFLDGTVELSWQKRPASDEP